MFTADSRFLVTPSLSRVNVETGKEVWKAKGGGPIAVGGQDKFVALALSKETTILEAGSGKLLRAIPPAVRAGDNTRQDVEISADETMVAVATGADGSAQVFSLPDGNHLSTISTEGKTASVAFSPDGKNLAVSSLYMRGVAIYDTARFAQSKFLKREDTDSRLDRHLTFSPDGKYLACFKSSDGPSAEVWIREIATEKVIFKAQAHVGNGDVAFSPNGKWIAASLFPVGGSKRGVRIWEIESGRELATLTEDGLGGNAAFAFSPNGKLIAVGGSASILLWEIE